MLSGALGVGKKTKVIALNELTWNVRRKYDTNVRRIFLVNTWRIEGRFRGRGKTAGRDARLLERRRIVAFDSKSRERVSVGLLSRV